jgi:hypothetical protein
VPVAIDGRQFRPRQFVMPTDHNPSRLRLDADDKIGLAHRVPLW